MTYGQLLEKLYKMSPAQLADDVTVCTPDNEFYPADLMVQSGDDVLHDGHLYINAFTSKDY